MRIRWVCPCLLTVLYLSLLFVCWFVGWLVGCLLGSLLRLAFVFVVEVASVFAVVALCVSLSGRGHEPCNFGAAPTASVRGRGLDNCDGVHRFCIVPWGVQSRQRPSLLHRAWAVQLRWRLSFLHRAWAVQLRRHALLLHEGVGCVIEMGPIAHGPCNATSPVVSACG